MLKKLILIVGLPGSGKSTAVEFIKKEFNADIFHTGDIIREEVKKRGLNYTPKTDAFIAHWFHTGGRERLLVKRVWDKVKKSKKNLIVIEAFRSTKNLKHLKKIARTKPVVIAIVSSFNVRVKRGLKRGRFGKEESVKYLRFRDRLEKGHGIEGLIKKADYKINNSKLSKKQTHAELSKIVKKIIKHDF